MTIMESIKKAAKEKKLLRVTYRDLSGAVTADREVEVYEIKGGTRLFVVDVDKDMTRQFMITGILSAEVLEDSTFSPRFPIKI